MDFFQIVSHITILVFKISDGIKDTSLSIPLILIVNDWELTHLSSVFRKINIIFQFLRENLIWYLHSRIISLIVSVFWWNVHLHLAINLSNTIRGRVG